MSRKLDDLSPTFRPVADRFLARLMEAGLPSIIVTTSRTIEEQADAVKRGVSWTMQSKHLTGDAIDIVPYETYALHGDDKAMWDERDPVWKRYGEIAAACGLKQGVVINGVHKDLGHFQLPS